MCLKVVVSFLSKVYWDVTNTVKFTLFKMYSSINFDIQSFKHYHIQHISFPLKTCPQGQTSLCPSPPAFVNHWSDFCSNNLIFSRISYKYFISRSFYFVQSFWNPFMLVCVHLYFLLLSNILFPLNGCTTICFIFSSIDEHLFSVIWWLCIKLLQIFSHRSLCKLKYLYFSWIT